MTNNKRLESSVMAILETAMEESTSIFILAFGIVLVIFSVSTDSKEIYIVASFFTLFYALINHFLATFSKIETFRPYARGSWMFLFYLAISFIALILWVIGTGFIILTDNLVTLREFAKTQYLFYVIPAAIFGLLIVIWIGLTFWFWKKSKREEETIIQEIGKTIYKITCRCENCGNFSGEVEIPQGLSYQIFPCPNCKVAALRKK